MTRYLRFGAMIATSTIVMFGLMYLNTYSIEHVYFSETRVYMALVMGAAMAVVMLLFMLRHVYEPGDEPRHPRASAPWCSPARSSWCAARRPSTTSPT